jgi:hypothetical protein
MLPSFVFAEGILFAFFFFETNYIMRKAAMLPFFRLYFFSSSVSRRPYIKLDTIERSCEGYRSEGATV